jgi:predicted alpha/beta-hydrolase family hydrolase
MQKFALETGEVLTGRAALQDTMMDLIADAVAALGVSTVYYITEVRKRRSVGARKPAGN